jgi:plastocyanin
MRRQLAALAFAPLLLAGCSSTHSTTTTTSGATAATAPNTIVIKNFAFSPADLTVAPGAKVTVTNEDSTTHTIFSTATPAVFNSGDVAPGKSVTFTAPTTAGTYSYICQIHQYMQGTLTVK